MQAACDRCHQSVALELWFRVFPVQDRVRMCTGCANVVKREARDRGDEGVDTSRLNNVAATLGGDVWRTGGAVFWFPWPVGVRSNGNGANGSGHKGNGNGARLTEAERHKALL